MNSNDTSSDADPGPGPVPGQPDFQRLVNAVEDYAIFLLDEQGRILSWNAGAQRIKGYAASEVLHSHFSRFYTDEAQASGWPQEELRHAREFGRIEDEGWRVRKDGTRFWANVVITALRNDAGELTGFAKITRDLTERRRVEESLRQSDERFRLLMQGVTDYAIVMLDTDGRITSWNWGATAITGMEHSEAMGRELAAFYSPEDAASGLPLRDLATARQEGRLEAEGWRLRRDGRMFWANVVMTAIRSGDGQLLGYAMVIRDMSERKRLSELESSSQRMNEFLAMLGHELRNPLAPIRNAVAIMGLLPDVSAGIAQCRDLIGRQTEQLTRLVDDLLDVGRITTGKIKLVEGPVELSEVVSRAVEGIRPLTDARRQPVVLEVTDAPVVVHGDRLRLIQAVQNLLDNASKFSGEGARITVREEIAERSVTLSVIDEGTGMDPGSVYRMFDLFVQGEECTDPGQSGLGIGLTVARSIIELHGGAISAKSSGRGLGSTFAIMLPRSDGKDKVEASPATARPLAAKRVLVVDDNRDAAHSLALLFRMLGHRAEAATSGEDALRRMDSARFDLVVTDLAMPGMSGFELLRALRERFPGLPVVAMSGYGTVEDSQRSLNAGFAKHLTKPVSLELIQSLVELEPRAKGNDTASCPR